MSSSREAFLAVLFFLAACGPEFRDGTILCDRNEQCYSGTSCWPSPDRSRKYCYAQPPAAADASDHLDAEVVDSGVPVSHDMSPAGADAAAPKADAGQSPEPDAGQSPPEPDAAAPPQPDAAAPDAADSCSTLSEGVEESLDDVVEDLGALALPENYSMRTPGPSTWLADGRRMWLLPSAARDDGGSKPPAPRNLPTAAWILSGSQSALKIDPPPSQEPPAFVALSADEAPETELWPSTLARNFSGQHPDTIGVAFLRRIVNGSVSDVMLARIAAESTVGTRLPDVLFTGTDLRFSTGLFSGSDNTYVYACDEDDSADASANGRYRCFVARTPNANIEDRQSYRVYRSDNGTESWSSDLSVGTPVLYGASDLSVIYSQYLHKKRIAVHVHPATGKLVVQTADRPWGPWTKRGEVDLPVGPDAEPPASAFVIMEDRCGLRHHVAYATPTRRDDRGNVVAAQTRLAAIRWR